MSMEIFVLSNKKLTSILEWQKAIDREGLSLRLDATRSIEELCGHLPAFRHGKHAGFECDHWTVEDIVESSPDIEFGGPWTEALAFRFGGDELALWGAFAAATAAARATDGVIFDGESGDVLKPDQAKQLMKQFEREFSII